MLDAKLASVSAWASSLWWRAPGTHGRLRAQPGDCVRARQESCCCCCSWHTGGEATTGHVCAVHSPQALGRASWQHC